MKKRKAHIANVTLIVTHPKGFRAVPAAKGGAYTRCKVVLRSNTGRVESGPNNHHVVHHCEHGPVVFKVRISPKGAYHPTGVAFEHTKAPRGAKKLKAGAVCDNFPSDKVAIRDGVLEFTDNCHACTAGMSFEYYVFIQRKDGKLGIIDPGIAHDPAG
jgi:hypothetical protein